MPRAKSRPSGPDWEALYQRAETQAGHFTLADARACGYSSQLLQKHLAAGRMQRVRRGIYRLAHFPITAHEELVALWLWSDRLGVFSHETSLALQDLSDVLPARVHMTLPTNCQRRRQQVPPGVVLHYADLPAHGKSWHEAIPLTAPIQVLTECVEANVSPELVDQAIRQALRRGLVAGDVTTKLRARMRQQSRRSS
jgi:predicted transcriptional regulator of viral defense system